MNETERSTFIEQNMGLVGMVVKKFYNRIKNYSHVDWEDLRNVGVIGLIKAYDRFDPSYGFKFTTYAVPMIRGEIQRFLRDDLDIVKFSRKVKENYYEVIKSNLLNESPGIIASILEIPIGHAEDALAYHSGKYPDSLERPVFENDGTPLFLGDVLGDETDFDSNIIISDFLKQFDDKTKAIMKLRLQNLSQVEVGKTLKISQVQVSRRLLAARNQLEKGGIKMSKNNNRDFNLAKKLAIETDLNGYEISEKSGVSSVTAYKYINSYRTSQKEVDAVKERINKKEPIVKTYTLSPEELVNYKQDRVVSKAITKQVKKERLEQVSEETNTFTDTPKSIIDPILESIETEKESKELENSYGHMAMTFNLTPENATSQLEDIINAMSMLGFKELKVTIQSEQVA